jgi:hypothetical protein
MNQALNSTRPGGHVGFVGVAHGVALDGMDLFWSLAHVHGGPAPVRRFLPELIDLIWNRQIDPARSSISTCRWRRPPRAIAPWMSARRSRRFCAHDLVDRRSRSHRRRRRAPHRAARHGRHAAPRGADLGRARRRRAVRASWRGDGGRWYRAANTSGEAQVSAGGVSKVVALLAAGDEVNDAVDAAYREKYGRYTGYVEPMIAPQARATTLRLVPRSEAGA